MLLLNQAENHQQKIENNSIKKSYINLFFYKIKKSITTKIKSKAGRNFLGRICVFHRGGANKRLYNQIDIYKRINEYGRIIKIYKQPNRSGLIGIILYYNGLVSLILLSEQVYIGSMLFNGAITPPNYNYLKAQG
jgi:ribosomal protein L2